MCICYSHPPNSSLPPMVSNVVIIRLFLKSVSLFLFYKCYLVSSSLDFLYHAILWYLSFSVWLTSLIMINSGFILVAANGICLFVCFLGLHSWCTEVPRPGLESELQLLAYGTATAMQEPRHIWDLYHSSWQHQLPDPLREARDGTCILVYTIQIHFHWATTGTPTLFHFFHAK